jgi:adenylyltransferase/sulfurtransferase
VIGALQATEAIKLIVGLGHPLFGQLLIYNAVNASFDKVSVEKNPTCPVCGE